MKNHLIIATVVVIALATAGCATTRHIEFDRPVKTESEISPTSSVTPASEKEDAEGLIKKDDGSPAVADKTDHTGGQKEETPEGYYVEKYIYVEKPVYYPLSAYIPPTGQDAVKAANATSQMLPTDYNGRIIFYDYDETFTYHVYCQPMRITDIYLEAGETIIEAPIIGDSSRWTIGYGKSVSGNTEVQHIYLKPQMGGLETTLAVNTSRRIYYLLIKSFNDTYMAGVKWRFAANELPQNLLPSSKELGKKASVTIGTKKYDINPELISTDYAMKYPGGKNTPAWLPTLVLDDGRKTYIYLPEDVEFHEVPALFMDKEELVNYRMDGNVIIVDRLVKKLYLKLRNVTVTVEKKEK